MVRYTHLDKKRSTDIKEQLGIFNMNEKLTQYKINLRKIYKKMDEIRLPRKISYYKPAGRRNIGKPQTRWEAL